jgi:hypothetical protein
LLLVQWLTRAASLKSPTHFLELSVDVMAMISVVVGLALTHVLSACGAASVAGLLLTTEVMIADAPKDEAEHSHGPPGGGMGDMGM